MSSQTADVSIFVMKLLLHRMNSGGDIISLCFLHIQPQDRTPPGLYVTETDESLVVHVTTFMTISIMIKLTAINLLLSVFFLFQLVIKSVLTLINRKEVLGRLPASRM